MLTVEIKKSFPLYSLDVSFSADDGVTVILGHSGAGKTTILNCIAGIVAPDEGKISVGEDIYFDSAARINLPVQKRGIGFVFQDYALFPHLTAEENIGFGVKSPSEKRETVAYLLKLLGIEGKAKFYPRELSGGERQRAAIARAIASEPSVMLLDEPLSAVDARMRRRLVDEISEIQRQLRIPFVYVTHNYAEALRIGDSAVVLDGGRIAKQGGVSKALGSLENLESQDGLAAENIFLGRIARRNPDEGLATVDIGGGCRIEASDHAVEIGSKVVLGIRPEDIIVSRERLNRTSARNLIRGVIKDVFVNAGRGAEIVVDCGVDFKVSVTQAAVRELRLDAGARVYLLIKARSCRFLG